MTQSDATIRQGYIAPHDLINTINLIAVVGFTGIIQRRGLAFWNINMLWYKDSVDCCVCLPSIL